MRLYLVQHGDAAPERLDPERPLSAAGRREVEAVARLLACAGARVAQVVHSGKLRAQQTRRAARDSPGVEHGAGGYVRSESERPGRARGADD